MADEQIVTNIVANADFSGLITDLARVTSALNNLQNQAGATNKALANQIAVMNRQFGDTLRSTGQFTTHFVTIGSDVDKFGKNLDAGRGKLRDFYGAWQGYHKQSNSLVKDLAKQQVQLQNSILQPLGRNADGMMRFAVQVPRGLDEIKSKSAIARQELQILNRVVQEGGNQLINWGKNTQWAGRQLTVGLTVPIAAFGKAASDAFRQADEELTRLVKVYGDVAGTSAVELGKVRKEVVDTAKELAASMGAGFKDTLALSADIAATGKTGTELLGSIRETTRLAILGEVDRTEAMKATLAIQSAFKQNTDELAQSINFLNAVENQTSTSLNDLVEAIPKAGPVVKGLGGSIQDLALYLTAMREGGINASEGANALKSALASLINPTDVAVAKFKGFGIDLLGIVEGNAGNVTNTLMSLQGALDSLDPLSKQQAIEQLFGKFQFARMNALFENLGKQGSQTLKVLDLMKASSGELSDLAGRELSLVTESASGKYRRALAELKADLATVGEKFLTINTYLIKFVDKIVDFANNLPGPIKAILGFLGGITAIAGPLIMLTGVLGNFFGYVIKGVSHFKSLFKGGEGWKLLTPEILAANKAGDLVEQTFYSDAKAAAVLNQALRDLTAQYDALSIRAQSGAISINPVLTNISAQAQAQGLSRVVDKNHPLVGEYGTRASAHMVPRNVDQPRTIFGLVPSSIPVNAAIGENPQIYSQGDLPDIKGVTSIPATRTIGGVKQSMNVSTGIVASEAARHHAYTAALAMQTEAEMKVLKQTLATTGTVSREFMDTFDDLLPVTSRITANAASQSAMIVAELQQGKITAAAAKQRIIELNLAIERELGAATSAYAGTVGRSINLTNVPGTNQPVQSATGKSNMREMFKTRTGGIFTRIAEALKVKTSGAGYNIETTKLRRYNSGGAVESFGANKTTVSGPTSINYDDRLGSVPLGGYVLNQGASLDPANQSLIAMAPYTFEGGGNITAALTPGEVVFGPKLHKIPGLASALDAANSGKNLGGQIKEAKRNYGAIRSTQYDLTEAARLINLTPGDMKLIDPAFRGTQGSYTAKGTSGLYIGDITDPTIINDPKYAKFVTDGVITREMINKSLESQLPSQQLPYQLMLSAIDSRQTPYRNSTEQFLYSLARDGIISEQDAKLASSDIHKQYSMRIRSRFVINDDFNPLWGSSHAVISRRFAPDSDAAILWNQFSAEMGHHTNTARRSTTARSIKLKTPGGKTVRIGKLQGDKTTMFAHASTPKPFKDRVKKAGVTLTGLKPRPFKYLNKGGFIGGGNVMPGRRNYGRIDLSGIPGIGEANAASGSHISGPSVGQKAGMGTEGSFVAGMGLQTAGYMAGQNENTQQFAMPLMAAGTLMQMSPMIKPLTQAMSKIKTMGGMFAALKNIATRALLGIRTAITFLTGPIGLTILAVTALAAIFLKLKRNAEDAGKANRLAFGGTKDSFASVGIKQYQSLSEKMEEHVKNVELAKAKIASSYNSFTKVKGPTGLTLTIEQLDKAVENAKKNQKDYVEGFNNIDSSRVDSYAASLKAQFVGMGMSASDATNQIYAIIKASDKANQALGAISAKSFKSIQTAAQGVAFMVKALNKELNSKDFNAEEYGTGIDTLLNSLYAYQDGLIGTKTKTGEIIDETDALKMALDKVVKIEGSRTTLSEDQLDSLKEQNVVYGSILGKNENLRSITAKILMYNAGLGEIVDLSQMGAQEAVKMANNLKAVQDAMNAITIKTTDDNPLSPLARLRNSAKLQSEESQKALKKLKEVDEDYYNKKIENHQRIIDKIEEETAARLKLLDVEQQRVDYESELAGAKLRYEQALANGDMAQAAQEQLTINKIMSDRQRQLTSQSITDKAEKDKKAQQEEIDKLQKQLDAAKDGYSATTAKASSDLAAYQVYEDYMNRFEAIAIRNLGKKSLGSDDKKEMAVLLQEMIDAGGKLKEAALAIKADYPGTTTTTITANGPVTTKQPGDWMNGLINQLKAASKSVSDGKFSTAVANFAAAVEKFAGQTSTNMPTKDQQQDVPWYEQRSGASIGEDISYIHFVFKNKKYSASVGSREWEDAFADAQDIGAKNISWNKYRKEGWTDAAYDATSSSKPFEGLQYTKKASGGMVQHFEPGGKVSGPGTGTSDSIPAMLSDGEFVVKASAVKQYGVPLLHAINSQKFANGGKVTPWWKQRKWVDTAGPDFDYYSDDLGGFPNDISPLNPNGLMSRSRSQELGIDEANSQWYFGGDRGIVSKRNYVSPKMKFAMGGMVDGYKNGTPGPITAPKWTTLDGKKHYVFDKLSGGFGISVIDTKGMTLEQLNARYIDKGVYTDTSKNTSQGPGSYNSAVGSGLFTGFSAPWLEFLGAKGIHQTFNKVFQGGKNKGLNNAYGSTPNNWDYFSAALFPLNFAGSGEKKMAVQAASKTSSLFSRFAGLGKESLTSAISKLGSFTAKSKFENQYAKYTSSPFNLATDIVKNSKRDTMSIRMMEQFALLVSKGLNAKDIYHTLPDGKLWIHPNVEKFLPPGFERNAVNNLWSATGHTVNLPEKEILAYYEKALIDQSKKVKSAKSYLSSPSSYLARIGQMGNSATNFQQSLLGKINKAKGIVPSVTNRVKSFVTNQKLGMKFGQAQNLDSSDPAKKEMYDLFGSAATKSGSQTTTEHAKAVISSYSKSVAAIEMQKKILSLIGSGRGFSFQDSIKHPEVLALASKAGIADNYIQNVLGGISRYISRGESLGTGIVDPSYHKDFAAELLQLQNAKNAAETYLTSPLSFIARFKEARRLAKESKAAGFSGFSTSPILNAVVDSGFIPRPIKNIFETFAGRTRSDRDYLGIPGKLLHPLDVPIDNARAYGPGTYFARTPKFSDEIFKSFGDNQYKPSLSLKALMQVIRSKGYIKEEDIYPIIESMGFDPRSLTGMPWDHPVIQKLIGDGYLGLKHRQAYTSWLTGLPGFNLKPTKRLVNGIKNLNYEEILGSTLDIGSRSPAFSLSSFIVNQIKDVIAPEKKATGGYVSRFANGGMINVPKFDQGINMVPADMLALIHKNEAVVPANMNPFNPNANNATMGGAQYNVNVTLNGSSIDADDVARVITRELKIRESMNGRSVIR